ncbi:MAG: M48 family metalloprotease [Desulfatiglandaceae bacterium]
MKHALRVLILCCILATGAKSGQVYAAEGSASPGDVKWLLLQASEEEKALDRSGLIYEDPDLERYLNRVVRNLQPAEFQRDLSFRVKVIKDPHLNAFAFPDGAIYVNTGMLARIENEAQLATILAHEMGHALRRHALKIFRALKDRATACAAIQEGFAQSSGPEAVERFLGSKGLAVSGEAFSRSLEQEADRVGLELMIKAGYSPEEAVDLFAHLEKESIKQEIHEPFVSEARPSLRDRMRNFEEFLHAHGDAEKSGIIHREIFLLRTKGALLENARLDLKLGRFTAAHREAEKYLGIAPRDAKALYLLGEVSRQRGSDGDIRLARALYEKAISMDPSYAEPYRALGLIQYKAGEMVLARKSFQWCLLLSPDRPDKAYIQGYLRKCDETGAREGTDS